MKTLFLLLTLCAVLLSATAPHAQPVAWTEIFGANIPFASAGSAVLGNYFYCFGGDLVAPIAQAQNLTTDEWVTSTTPPLGWNRFASTNTNDAVYLIGWCTTWPTFGNATQKFTPDGGGPSGQWTQLAGYPITAVGIAAAWDGGNYIFAAGGIDENGTGYATAYKYNIAANNWSPIANMPSVMIWSGAAFCLGKLYIVGGTNMPSTLLEYDPANNSWTEKAPPPAPIYNGNGTTCSAGLVYSISGGGISFPQSNAVQVYNPRTNSWSQETPLPATLGANSARFIPPDIVISAGGYLDGIYVANSYRGTGFPIVHGEGAETCQNAVEILSMPYFAVGNTNNNTDHYNPPFAIPGGRDVAYLYAPSTDQCLDISLCGSDYDTRLSVYQTSCTGVPLLINDDACRGSSNFPYPWTSSIRGAELLAGQTYYLIVDGYDASSFGPYQLNITPCGPPWVPDEPCADNSLFGQPHYNETMSFASDSIPGYRVYDNLSGLTEAICTVEFWGTSYRNNLQICNENPMDFEITFQADDMGQPGMIVCSQRVTLFRDSAQFYNGFPVWKYTAELSPCCTITEGWLSIQAVDRSDPGCNFFWAGSPSGDNIDWMTGPSGTQYRLYTDRAFCLLPVLAADPAPGTLPERFTLHQNYPNPFNPITTIAFDLPHASRVSLRVFDLIGREVAILQDGRIEAGSHKVKFEGSGLASGMYFARFVSPEYSHTTKMMLLK